jgi:pimeloyl-ACP methyl ester carboxylesterase
MFGEIRSARGWRSASPRPVRAESGVPSSPVRALPRAPRLRSARAAEGRARLIARGGFGYGERATALLGSAASPDILAIVRHVLRATQPKGFLQAVRFVASGSAPPVLGESLSLPLLMIQGAEDRVTPAAANAALLAQALPRARLETLAGCGHLPEVEDYERVNKLAMRFLS